MTLLHKRCAPAFWSSSWILSYSSASFLCCGSQTWIYYSRWTITWAGQGRSIISFTLLDPLLVDPCMRGIQLVLGCKPVLLACIKLFIHQNLQAFCTAFSMHCSLSLYTYLKLSWSKCRTLHMALLSLIRFLWTHFLSLLRCFWMAFLPAFVSTTPLSLVSLSHLIPLSVLLMKMLRCAGL